MRIKVRVFTKLAEYVPEHEPGETFVIDLPENEDMTGLLRQLGIPAEEAKIIMVNGRARLPDHILHTDDEVALFPPIGGG